MLKINLLTIFSTLFFTLSFSKSNSDYTFLNISSKIKEYALTTVSKINSYLLTILAISLRAASFPFAVAYYTLLSLYNGIFTGVSSFFSKFSKAKIQVKSKTNPDISNDDIRRIQLIVAYVQNTYTEIDSMMLMASLANGYNSRKIESEKNAMISSEYIKRFATKYNPDKFMLLYKFDVSQLKLIENAPLALALSLKSSGEYLPLFEDIFSVDTKYTFDLTTGEFLKLQVVGAYDHNVAQAILN